MKKIRFVILITLIFFLNIQNIWSETFIKKGEKINAVADHIYYDLKNQIIRVNGNASVKSETRKIKGDFISIDKNNNTLSVRGNAVIESNQEKLYGDELFIDYQNKKGVIKNGRIFVEEIHFYISGEKIEKISENTYIAENASVTSCDNPDKDWAIKADKIKATLDGYGYAVNARFNAMDRPLFYAPWMFFPVKTKRQSGLLIPEIEFSDKYGAQYNQPLYLVLSDQADATLYYHFIEKRSDRKGIEFRLRNSKESYTELFYDEMKNDPYLYNPNGAKGEKILPHERYWLRLKSDLKSGSGFKVNIDLDHASDPGYISEFKSSYLGYEKTDKAYSDNFGRNLEPDDEYKRTNRVLFSKRFKKSGFEAEFLWNDDLTFKETGNRNNVVQSLPRFSFDVPRTSFLNLPIQTSFETEYNYFHRIYGERGHRYNLTPKIYLPINFSNYLSIEPSAYINETFWHTSNKEVEDKDNEYNFRQIYGFDLAASTSVFRVFNINGDHIEKIRHTIEPEIKYSFVPDQEKDQEKLPNFDDFDRIERKKEVKLTLTQTLTSKEKIPSFLNGAEKYEYREYLRFKLSQIYDISENEKAQEAEKEEEYEAKPFDDLEAYLKFSPTKRFYIEYDAKWSHYDHRFSERNLSLNAQTEKGSRFGFEHRYKYEENESLKLTLDLVFSPVIKIHGMYETALMEDSETTDNYEKEFGLEYISQCWSSDISYNETEDEKKVTFKIYLKGLGELYQGISED